MTELTMIEQLEVHGGKWNWGEFVADVGLGIGFAVCISTGNVLGAVAMGFTIGAQFYDSK
jgi:hypothetical protein